MTSANLVKAAALVAFGLAIAAMGVYVAEADDAPGGAAIGILLMCAAVAIAVQAARNRLPAWAARTALVAGAVIAGFAAFITHAVTVAAPLFAQPPEVPSVMDAPPSPQYAAAVERARELVRAAVLEQNLPGVSVAVGAGLPAGAVAKEGGAVVWAEGFGWRDVETQTLVTPHTRFNIGSATPVVSAASAAALGMTSTGFDTTADWSPSHNGEPEDDFPLFTLAHDLVLRPLGISPPAQPLPGERATYYVPRSDDNEPRRGRRPIYMRDLACCPGGKAFSSTPSDLVRFSMGTNTSNVDGELAGGSVMSLLADRGIVVAVASNITHAKTAALARKIADVFAGRE